MLKELFERVLKEYKSARNENFVGHPIANILRNEIPEELKQDIENLDKYKVSGSAGQGNWTYSPWVAVMNRKVTESPQKGYYLVYLFQEDMKGVYLSLNQGMTEIKNQNGSNDTKGILRSKAGEYREELGEHPELLNSIDLRPINSSSNSIFYEEGNIYAKYYDLSSLPSDNVFLNDLRMLLDLYDSIVDGNMNLEWAITKVKESYESSGRKNAENEVIEKYGKMFHPNNLNNLTSDDFKSFLSYQNNKHWTGLHRRGSDITKDMARLREGLQILLNENLPLKERLDTFFPKDKPSYIKYLGRAIATPILMVVYPQKYGVYNNISEKGLKKVDLEPEFSYGASFSEKYIKVNAVFKNLADKYDLSLFELDEVWDLIVRERESTENENLGNFYWVTVGKTLQPNYKIGIDNNVWGVKEDYNDKASKLKVGDYLLIYSGSFGFTLCEIKSKCYEDKTKLWPDDLYSIRFKISDPIYQESLKPDNIHKCLKDTKGIPYKNGSAWGRAIGGSGGILREIKPDEIECLFNKLGWDPLISEITQDTPEILFLNPKDMDPEIKLKKGVLDNICALLNSGKHILLTGPPGTGKTDLAKYIANEIVKNGFSDGYILTTATSDWTTFDTIGGYMPDNNGGSLSFYEGKFLQAIRENKTLLIDEINRSDIDKAFGQLFTVLSGQGVEIPFILNSNHVKIIPNNGEINSCRNEFDSSYIVGKNWRIISTMNVFDKNYLFEMSYAFMRRFAFIYIDLPEDNDYKYLIREKWAQELDEGYIELIEKLLNINEYRPLGPAIFKDICEFVKNRVELLDNPDEGINNKILIDAFISFIIPQFEGLEISELENIWKILDSYIKEDIETKLRFEEMGFSPKDIKAK